MSERSMRAGVFVAPGTMECREADVRAPGDGELLVRTRFASICGSDLHSVFPAGAPARLPGPPGFPGHEGVGEVIESRDHDYKPGDLVLTVPNYSNGMCFAEYQTIAARYCLPVPEADVPLEHVLMAQQLGTVVFALKRRPVSLRGKNVVIIGHGSAGAFFAFLARRAGAGRIVVTDLSEARLSYARKLGVDVAIDASADDPVRAVREATDGHGGDFVVEAVGQPETLKQSVAVAAPGGDLLWFGLPYGQERMPFTFGEFFVKRLSAAATFGAQDEPGHASFREALDLIVKREIDVAPLLSHVLPIEEIGKAFVLAHERTDNALKVSLRF